MLLHQRALLFMRTINNNRRKSTYVSRPLSMEEEANITFAQSKKKNSLEQAAIWHEAKVVCCLLLPF